jgi:hypothetical protein
MYANSPLSRIGNSLTAIYPVTDGQLVYVRGNPLAPQWMTGVYCHPEIQDGMYDEANTYTFESGSLAAATTSFGNFLRIDSASDFIWREIEFANLTIGSTPAYGNIQVRFRDASGKALADSWLNIDDIRGPVFPNLMAAGSLFTIDIRNRNAVTAFNTQILFRGVKRFSSRRIACLQPSDTLGITAVPNVLPYIPTWQRYSLSPKGYHDEHFTYYYTFVAAANVSATQFLIMDTDAPFYWRGVTYQAEDEVGDTDVRLIITNPRSQALQNSNSIFIGNWAGRAPRLAPIYPEVYAPEGSAFTLDLIEYLGVETTVRLALEGVKRVRD